MFHKGWEVRWADRTEFNKLRFSKRMVFDHLPFRLMRSLTYFSQFHKTEDNVEENENDKPITITIQP